MKKILIVDDDISFGLMLKTFLEKNKYEVKTVLTAGDGLKGLKNAAYDLVITDLRLPDIYGLDFLEKVKRLDAHLPVVLMTGYADIQSAVEAMKLGAVDYITKPIKPDELLAIVKSTFKKPVGLNKAQKKQFVVGESEVAKALQEQINIVAPTDISVIIFGESGTGKEYVANAIHEKSKRSEGPFVAVDCGALPKEIAGSELFGHVKGAFTGALADKKGQFEVAEGGTIFLDEIGNLTYENQVMLLRAMQEKAIRRVGGNQTIKVDVRVIAATNNNLPGMVKDKTFREDLFFRINEFSIYLSPLRERRDDIPLFINHFLEESNQSLDRQVDRVEDGAMEKLVNYRWPGNLRELKNVIKRAVLFSEEDKISIDNLPSEVLREEASPQPLGYGLKSVTEQKEKELIIEVLAKARYNKAKAARLLKIDRKTLYSKIAQFNIQI